MVVGSMAETLGEEIPCSGPGGFVIWDQQEKKPVITVHGDYAQLLCLELADKPENMPFTNLEKWLNTLDNESLDSENIPTTKHVVTPSNLQ